MFVVTVFLILTYILLSVSVWVKGIEASERGYSEFYKESTVDLAISQITEDKIRNVSSRIVERSAYRLNNHSIQNPVSESGSDDLGNVRLAMEDLFINGSANASLFESGYGITAEDSSIRSWAENLNASLLSVGISIDRFEIRGFNISQSRYDKINYSYEMHLSMSDESGRMSVTRDYLVSDNISIRGFVDPAIVRESAEATMNRQTAYRRFYFEEPGDSAPMPEPVNRIGGYDVHGGQGWFFGYLVAASAASSIDELERHRFILVGSFDELTENDPLQQYGAYIMTSAPGEGSECDFDGFVSQEDTLNPVVHSGDLCDEVSFDCGSGECTAKPFIEAEGFDLSYAPDCPVFDPSIGGGPGIARKCALFTNPNSVEDVHDDPDLKLDNDGGIYNVEGIRDHIMCGYYAESEDAPSYLQRLLPDAYSHTHDEHGIQTFVIGEYANDDEYSLNSRLDQELYSEQPGNAVMGMPGCKRLGHCTINNPFPVTGLFTLTEDSAAMYGIGDAYCSDERRCE
jgi:hypothetical protein